MAGVEPPVREAICGVCGNASESGAGLLGSVRAESGESGRSRPILVMNSAVFLLVLKGKK